MKWWSDELSQNQYDGIIGLSQGSAMTALLISMVGATASPNSLLNRSIYALHSQLNHPERVPGFHPQKTQPIKFAILCSGAFGLLDVVFLIPIKTGFISNYEPHKQIYGIPENLPTLHSKLMLYSHWLLLNFFLVAVDMNDYIVPAQRTFELQKLCNNSRMVRHNEGE